jgi:hypothetical protein
VYCETKLGPFRFNAPRGGKGGWARPSFFCPTPRAIYTAIYLCKGGEPFPPPPYPTRSMLQEGGGVLKLRAAKWKISGYKLFLGRKGGRLSVWIEPHQ